LTINDNFDKNNNKMKLLAKILIILILTSCNSSQSDKIVRLDYEELIKKESSELRIIRNEIFARHGYIFKSQDLKDYFSSKDWYKPKFENVDSYLTDDEKQYIQVIRNAENYVKKLNNFKEFFIGDSDTNIGNLKLPENLKNFIDKFGKPDSTFIDNDEFCPIGQLHFWNFNNENLRLIVLGDSYGEPVKFDTKTRLIIFQRIDDNIPSNILTFNNIHLNDTEQTIKKIINNFINSHDDFKLDIFESPTLIDNFITDNLGKIYWLTDNKVFFHFVFDKNGKLEYIVETNFNIRTAC